MPTKRTADDAAENDAVYDTVAKRRKYDCVHGKYKYNCKECGGSSICKHNRLRFTCKECGGSGICEHDRLRFTCKECGGSGICEHDRQRSKCKECGGSEICAHDRQRSKCKECGGSGICEHNRERSKCKECGGSQICAHDRVRSSCKECGGSQICAHDRQRSKCKECGGSEICEHDRRRSLCKECGGSQICAHDRVRSTCKECGGSQICEHDRQRSRCTDCVPLEKQMAGKSFCKAGCGTILSPLRRHTGLCAGCDAIAPRMQWITWDLLKAELPEPTFKDNKLIGGDACSTKRSRPDFGWVLPDRIVYLEIDEHSHEDREISCELAKLDSANWGLAESGTVMAKLPTFMIRFNCSEYDRGRISLEDRCETLVKYIKQKLTTEDITEWDVMRLNVSFLYYHSKSDKHIEAAQQSVQSINVYDLIK